MLLYVWFEHPGHPYRGFGFIFSQPGCDKWYQSYIDRRTQALLEMVDFQNQINLSLLSSTSIFLSHCLKKKKIFMIWPNY
jgi:hypothetical protein